MTVSDKQDLKILVAIANYGARHDQYLLELIKEYQSMSFQVDVIVFSNVRKHVAPGVELVVLDDPGEDPCALPFPHKQVFADRLKDYDLFIYSEDDSLVREPNIEAFVDLTKILPENEIAGFLRFEREPDGRLNYPDVHGHYHWDAASVRLRGECTLAFFTNEHAACYILTRDQLRRAIQSGGFLNAPHCEKYDMICTAATDPYTQCGFEKLICISHLDKFLIHHLPNTYIGSSFGVSEAEFSKQVTALLRAARSGKRAVPLFDTETDLPNGWYSKRYYEPIQVDAIASIPGQARTVLSIGCGWGATETWLAENGIRVTAIPLDPLIADGVESKGIELVSGDLEEALAKLAGREFDCIFLSNMLHLVPKPVEVLRVCTELLSPNGVCVAVVPNTGRLSTAWKTIRSPGRRGRLAGAVRALLAPGGGASVADVSRGTARAVSNSMAKAERGKDGSQPYATTRLHLASGSSVRKWFQAAGMRLEGMNTVLHPLQRRISPFALGLLDRWLASEFVAVARKDLGAPARAKSFRSAVG